MRACKEAFATSGRCCCARRIRRRFSWPPTAAFPRWAASSSSRIWPIPSRRSPIRAPRVLRRPRCCRAGRRRARGRRHLDAGGSCELSGRRAQTAGRRIPWGAHRVGIASLIGRHRSAGCAQYPLRLRSASLRFRHAQAPGYRSHAPCVSRPRDLPGGSRLRENAAGAALSQGLRGRAAQQHPHRQGHAVQHAAGHRVGAGRHADHAFFRAGCRGQPRRRHHLGEPLLRHGLHAAQNRRAAQRHHGRFLHQARQAQ